MTGMDELIAFVRAQLDEDERVARSAAASQGQRWWGNVPPGTGHPHTVRREDTRQLVILTRSDNADPVAAIQHIALWDPARALAEVEAKRQLLDDLVRELGDDDTNETARWYVQLLALPYAGRDGYRESWRPDVH